MGLPIEASKFIKGRPARAEVLRIEKKGLDQAKLNVSQIVSSLTPREKVDPNASARDAIKLARDAQKKQAAAVVTWTDLWQRELTATDEAIKAFDAAPKHLDNVSQRDSEITELEELSVYLEEGTVDRFKTDVARLKAEPDGNPFLKRELNLLQMEDDASEVALYLADMREDTREAKPTPFREHVGRDDSTESEFGSLTGTDVATLAREVKPHTPFFELLLDQGKGGKRLLPEHDFFGNIIRDFGGEDTGAPADTDEQKPPIAKIWDKALTMVRAEDFADQVDGILAGDYADVALLLGKIRELDEIPVNGGVEEKTAADFLGEVLTNPDAMRKGVLLKNTKGNLVRVFEKVINRKGDKEIAVRNGQPFSLEDISLEDIIKRDVQIDEKAREVLEILGEYGVGQRVVASAIGYEIGSPINKDFLEGLNEVLTEDWDVTTKRGAKGGVALERRKPEEVTKDGSTAEPVDLAPGEQVDLTRIGSEEVVESGRARIEIGDIDSSFEKRMRAIITEIDTRTKGKQWPMLSRAVAKALSLGRTVIGEAVEEGYITQGTVADISGLRLTEDDAAAVLYMNRFPSMLEIDSLSPKLIKTLRREVATRAHEIREEMKKEKQTETDTTQQ